MGKVLEAYLETNLRDLTPSSLSHSLKYNITRLKMGFNTQNHNIMHKKWT